MYKKPETMRKILVFSSMFVFIFPFYLSAQRVISANSPVREFSMQLEFKRGIPPNLFAVMEFTDLNRNEILEADETGEFTITIENKGKGDAQNLRINFLEEGIKDPALKITGKQMIPFLKPNQKVTLNYEFKAGFNIHSATHRFKILV